MCGGMPHGTIGTLIKAEEDTERRSECPWLVPYIADRRNTGRWKCAVP